MKLAVYTYNAEPYVWYHTPRVSFIDFSKQAPAHGNSHSIWKKVDPGRDFQECFPPMQLLPMFDAWLRVDPRVGELTIDFNELAHQICHLDRDKIYGIGKSDNGFRTISTGCLAEPCDERNESLLSLVYDTVIMPDARKYSRETPLQTFSALLFFRSPRVENACRDMSDMVYKLRGLNPQVALNWTAWKNLVEIDEIEDLRIQSVRHKIWVAPYIPPNNDVSENSKQSVVEAKSTSNENLPRVVPAVDPIAQQTAKNKNINDKEPNVSEHKAIGKDVAAPLESRRPVGSVVGSVNAATTIINHDVLAKLIADNMPASSARQTIEHVDMSLPPVSIMMTTWNRTPLAVTCLKALVEKIDYPRQKLSWILADDGSEPGHVEACIDTLIDSGIAVDHIYTARNFRSGEGAKFGHAANLNNGLREAFKHSDIVLRTEDDLLPSRTIPVKEFAKILADNANVAGIKLGHAADATRTLPWKISPGAFVEDASHWNVFIFNHLAMICHKRAYDALGMYNEQLSGADVERDIGKRFMEKFRNRSLGQEYDMKVLIPKLDDSISMGRRINWLYFTHIGKDSVSGHHYRVNWTNDVIKLNSNELGEDMRANAAKM